MNSTGHIALNVQQSRMLAETEKKANNARKISEARSPSPQKTFAPVPKMSLVEESEKASLYEGVSKENQGRFQYLKEQKEKSPQQRFRSPVTSSQAVGWAHSEFSDPRSPFGVKMHLAESWRSSGVATYNDLPK